MNDELIEATADALRKILPDFAHRTRQAIAQVALAVIAPAVLEDAASLADDYGVDVPNTAPAHQAAWDAADGIRALKARYV